MLVHRLAFASQLFLMLPFLSRLSFKLAYLFTSLFLISSALSCAAQIVAGGQIYTSGLAIIDSPQPNSQFHSGSNLPIAIEVSGNGKLPFAAFRPGSGLETSYELLEIYLVSSQTQLNLTVSSGTGLLTDEGGTVRHKDFSVPSCVPSGTYNLTFYETSYINGKRSFTITPIPISIENSADLTSGGCTVTNSLQSQPQPSSETGESPFLPNKGIVVSTGVVPPSVTPLASVPTVIQSTSTIPFDATASPSGLVTLVIISQLVTTVTNSLERPITTSFLTTRTTTVPMATANAPGFIPLNTAGKPHPGNVLYISIPVIILAYAMTLVS